MYEATFDESPILAEPPAGAVPILHDREYRVRAFRISDDRILIQGAICDMFHNTDDLDRCRLRPVAAANVQSFADSGFVRPRALCQRLVDHRVVERIVLVLL